MSLTGRGGLRVFPEGVAEAVAAHVISAHPGTARAQVRAWISKRLSDGRKGARRKRRRTEGVGETKGVGHVEAGNVEDESDGESEDEGLS